jgi:serine/threonine protein kinase
MQVGRYLIISQIGSGSFSTIHSGEHVETHCQVAVKLEPADASRTLLLHECRVYRYLSAALGFSPVHWFGTHLGYSALVTDLLGPSISDLFNRRRSPFPLKTVLMLTDQMLARVEFLHRKGILHRDIKPENFLIGRGDEHSVVYLIDFGLSSRYVDFLTHEHAPYRESREVVGTARYISVNTHIGVAASRRDDLESLAYLIVYIAKGCLPWQGISGETQADKYEAIGKLKMLTQPRDLCADLPEEFAFFLEHTRGLRFADEPDYEFYRRLFRNLFVSRGFLWDHYDF